MNHDVASSSAGTLALRIAELGGEIHECISHIACNDLRALEESLWRQELLASTLLTSAQSQNESFATSAAGQVLRSMASSLLATNQSYSELLAQVQRDNHCLLTLAHEYTCKARTGNLPNLQYSFEV